MNKLNSWINQWGRYVYGGCGLAWLVGYLSHWRPLLWSGVGLALLTTAISEAADYYTTRNRIHLLIPLLTVLSLMVSAWALLKKLVG